MRIGLSMKKKKILIIGFIVALMLAIPLSILALKGQQVTTSKATPATTLSFSAPGKAIAIGDNFNLDVLINPGNNQVSFVQLVVQYDGAKLKATGIKPNSTAFPVTLETPDPKCDGGPSCSIAITVSVGADPTKVVTAATTVATISFTAVAGTNGTPTQVTFSSGSTKVYSTAGTDQPSENVLASSQPASIDIGGGATPTIAPTDTPTPTAAPTAPTSSPTPAPTTSSNQSPVCSSLSLSATTGSTPLTLTLTAAGSDADGTISKATFNFGDGQTQDIVSGGGIGSGTASVQITHTYSTAGSFTATSLFTDNNGAISDTATCSQILTVNAGAQATGSATPTPIKSLPKTGPEHIVIGIGIFGILLSIFGGFILFGM